MSAVLGILADGTAVTGENLRAHRDELLKPETRLTSDGQALVDAVAEMRASQRAALDALPDNQVPVEELARRDSLRWGHRL